MESAMEDALLESLDNIDLLLAKAQTGDRDHVL